MLKLGIAPQDPAPATNSVPSPLVAPQLPAQAILAPNMCGSPVPSFFLRTDAIWRLSSPDFLPLAQSLPPGERPRVFQGPGDPWPEAAGLGPFFPQDAMQAGACDTPHGAAGGGAPPPGLHGGSWYAAEGLGGPPPPPLAWSCWVPSLAVLQVRRALQARGGVLVYGLPLRVPCPVPKTAPRRVPDTDPVRQV